MEKKVTKINQLQDKVNKTIEKLAETENFRKHYQIKLKEEEKEKKELLKENQDLKTKIDKLTRENTELRQGMVAKEKNLIETIKSLKHHLKEKDIKNKELRETIKSIKGNFNQQKKEKSAKDIDSSWSEDEMLATSPNLFGA